MVVHDKVTSHQVDAVFDRAVAADNKRIEDQPQGFLRQTRPVIAHFDLYFLLAGSRAF